MDECSTRSPQIHMDTELNAWTAIGQWGKVKANFRETQTRLEALEKTNRSLIDRIAALEARIKSIEAGQSATTSPTMAEPG